MGKLKSAEDVAVAVAETLEVSCDRHEAAKIIHARDLAVAEANSQVSHVEGEP